MAAAIAFVFGAAMLAWAALAARRGRLWDRDEDFDGGWVVRSASPLRFWILVALTAALGIMALALGIIIVQSR